MNISILNNVKYHCSCSTIVDLSTLVYLSLLYPRVSDIWWGSSSTTWCGICSPSWTSLLSVILVPEIQQQCLQDIIISYEHSKTRIKTFTATFTSFSVSNILIFLLQFKQFDLCLSITFSFLSFPTLCYGSDSLRFNDQYLAVVCVDHGTRVW